MLSMHLNLILYIYFTLSLICAWRAFFNVFILLWQLSFQHFECEPSEYNQKYFTLISNSHLLVHSNLRSRTP